jgi:hypothetical protein
MAAYQLGRDADSADAWARAFRLLVEEHSDGGGRRATRSGWRSS